MWYFFGCVGALAQRRRIGECGAEACVACLTDLWPTGGSSRGCFFFAKTSILGKTDGTTCNKEEETHLLDMTVS